MKIRLLLSLLSLLSAAACVNQPLPKDAHLKGVDSQITTPWGTGKMHIDEADTGAAARNATVSKP